MNIPVDPPYNLRRTLECGQVFRWTCAGDLAVGIYRGQTWTVRQTDGTLEVLSGSAGNSASRTGLMRSRTGASEVSELCAHLGVSAPLRRIESGLARDRVLRRVLPQTSGIAIMRQDAWECLVSFIISAFNNIPKIRLTVETLSHCFGEPTGGEWHTFPSPERLADARLSALRRCILGYRAPYIRAVARAVADGEVNLDALRALPYEDARKVLLALPGVGEKVAECFLLFALDHGEAFPVDVWIQRAVEQVYLKSRRASPRTIRAWAQERFGRLAGYANQHLFMAARQRLLPL